MLCDCESRDVCVSHAQFNDLVKQSTENKSKQARQKQSKQKQTKVKQKVNKSKPLVTTFFGFCR
jgi:alanyl-tRNA synthetase